MQIKAKLMALLLALLTTSLMTPPTYAAGSGYLGEWIPYAG
jgi:hypothetical protein